MVKPRERSARTAQVTKTPRIDWLGLIPDVIGGLAIFIGILIMVGWYAHWIPIIQPLPGLAPMQFNTAVAFTLCGAGLLLLSRGQSLIVCCLGGAAAMVGVLTMTEYLAGLNFGIDQFFIKTYITTAITFPGRMSPLTASCFIFLGSALAVAGSGHSRRRLTTSGLLACAVTMIALVALLGYAFSIQTAYGWGSYARMAPHTAATFFLVGMGLLVWSSQTARKVHLDFLRWLPVTASVTLMVMVAVISSVSFAQLNSSNALQNHTYDVINVAQGLLGDLTDTQRGMRGSILSGQPEALDLYQQAVDDIPTQLDRLQTLTSDNPDQQARLVDLRAAVGGVVSYSHRLLAARDKRGIVGAVEIEETGEGLEVMNRARAVLRTFTGTEQGLLQQRMRAVDSDFESTKRMVVFGTTLAGLLILLANFMATREVGLRSQTERVLETLTQRLKLAAEAADMGVWDWNVHNDRMTWDKKMYDLYGITEGLPVHYETWTHSIVTEDLPHAEATLKRAIADKTQATSEYRITKLRGGIRHIFAAEAVILDSAGRVSHVVGVNMDITERKNAEIKLRENEARYQALYSQQKAILNSANQAIISVDVEGTIKTFNETAERWFGYAAEELIGKATPKIFHVPEEVAARAEALTRELGRPIKPGFETFIAKVKPGQAAENEWTFVRKDGSRFPVWLSISLMTDVAGNATGYLGVVIDITERKKTEETLRLSEERFRLIVDGVKDYALFMLDPDGTVASWNTGAQNLKGYTAKDIIGKHFSCFYTPADIKRRHPEHELEIATREGRYEEIGWRVRKDGSRFFANVVVTAVYDSGRRLRGFANITRDVTEQQRARDEILQLNDDLEKRVETRTQELSESENRLRVANEGLEKRVAERTAELNNLNANLEEDIRKRKELEKRLTNQAQILDLANDTIFVRNLDDKIIYWNQGAQRVYGWSKEEVMGRVTHDFLGTTFPQPLEEIQAQLWREGHWEGELIHTRRDGAVLNVVSRWTLQRDDQGNPASIIEMNFDITERKKMERDLHDKNLELLNAARAKNSFLANMSHELRTPLNGIIGFSEILADGLSGEVNPEQKEYLGDILNSAQHLLQLINDVLDLAKVESGKIELHPEAFSVPKAIEQVCSVAYPLVQKKKIQLVKTLDPKVDLVTLDEKRFKQILYNLFSNAIKFTDPSGRVEIIIATKDETHFILSVKDTGIGIKPEGLKRLFKEFEQLDEGTTRRYQGTGLGLALTRKIVEAQGGVIEVTSEFGKGTTFTATLPFTWQEVAS
jgi:PAS domain S-box-containing protein